GAAFRRGGRAHARRAGRGPRGHGPLPELGRAPARRAAGGPGSRARFPARRHLAHLRAGLRGSPHDLRAAAALPPPAGARGAGLRGDGALPDERDGGDTAGGAAGQHPPDRPAGPDVPDRRAAHPAKLRCCQIWGPGVVHTRDLFVRARSGTLSFLTLLPPGPRLRRVFAVCTVLVAVCVLWQHVHYTVDVLVAAFFAFASREL